MKKLTYSEVVQKYTTLKYASLTNYFNPVTFKKLNTGEVLKTKYKLPCCKRHLHI